MRYRFPFHSYWILVLTTLIGLGIAFTLPWLANSQSRAAQGDTEVHTSASDVNKPGWSVNSSSVDRQELAPTAPTTYHVTKTGDGSNGLDWTKAYTDVQAALAAADSGDEIWVASGVYTPGVTVSDTFQLLDDVAIYGGFAATETQRTERDWQTNLTVLSGDIGGDDTYGTDGVVLTSTHIVSPNVYHVVTGSGVTNTAVLDGFTITAGQADGSWSDPCGPACGGGMYNDNGSPTLTNVVFSGNYADFYGGGMYNDNGSPSLKEVVFSGNSGFEGGGMVNYSSNPALINVVFSRNSATYGGGMYNDNSSPALTNTAFSGNSAGAWGGGIYNVTNSSPDLTNVVISGNWAGDNGGGMGNISSSADVRNSILWNNRDSSGTGTITATIANDVSSAITLTHSLAQGAGESGSWITDTSYVDGGDNIDEDPLFILDIDPSTAPTTTGDLRLQAGSPAIDAGDNAYITGILTDLDGEVRVRDGDKDGTATVDMGAYEYQPKHQLTVVKSGSGDGKVTSSPPGIDCGDTCSVYKSEDSTVTLTATADEGSTFSGWSGDCSGTDACELTIDAAMSVTATFEAALKVPLPLIFR